MFTMNYVNGIYPVSYTCYGERFHNCNACVYNHGEYTVFQSYQTPIAAYDSFSNELIVNEYFDCSATTRKQFSRWLRENNLPSCQTIKEFMYDSADGEIRNVDGFDLVNLPFDAFIKHQPIVDSM